MGENDMPEPQQLSEFTQSLVADLKSGAISSQEALSASYQYSFLRDELLASEGTLRDALLVGGDLFRDALLSTFTNIQTKLAEMPSFQAILPDAARTEKEIRDVSALRAFAIDRIQKTSAARSPKTASIRNAFIHNVVTKYSSTLPTITETGVAQALVAASKDASLVGSPEKFAQSVASSLGGSDDIKNDIVQTLTQNKEFLPTIAAQTKHDEAIYEALLEHADSARPDVLADIVLNAPQNESIDQSILRATKLAGVAQALEESEGRRGGKLQFFSSGGAKGVAGGLQKGADGILSLVGEPVREMILAEKVNGTIRNTLKGSQSFVDRLGETFVRSAFFTHITQDLTKQLSDTTAGKGQAGTVFDDLVSSIFRGPLDPALKSATERNVMDYFELMRANANAPKGKAFIPPGYAIWDLYRRRENEKPIGARGRGWFPYLGLGALGDWLGGVFSGVVDRTTSFFFSSPRIPGQLSSSRRAAAIPIPIGEDMPLLVAIVVIATIVLFFLFPSNFNLSQISHSSKVSALFAALHPSKPDDGGKTCPDCKWPTPCGCITSMPPHGLNGNLNAIDAGTNGSACPSPNVDVYAWCDGTIEDVFDGLLDGEDCTDTSSPGCGYGYGNFIKLKCSDEDHMFLYGHLLSVSVSKGDGVSKGNVIGTTDDNGISTGPHLHFEMRDGNDNFISESVATVLPPELKMGYCWNQ